jgi:hypothetical protein
VIDLAIIIWIPFIGDDLSMKDLWDGECGYYSIVDEKYFLFDFHIHW